MKHTLVAIAIATLLGACSGSNDDATATPTDADPSGSDPDASGPLDPIVTDGMSGTGADASPGDAGDAPDTPSTPVEDAPANAPADTGTVSAPLLPDGAPPSLSATIASDTSATISWTAPAPTPADEPYAYEVRRDGALVRPFRGFAADEASATSYVDDFLVGGRAYTYEVVAIAYADEARSPAASITLTTPGGYVPAADGSAPDVNVDNHVALLAYAFDVFNGNADGYGHEILSLPGYSDPRYAESPGQVEAREGGIEELTCGNGGTAAFTPYTFGDREVTTGWTFAFEDCQDGARVLDGDFFRSDSSRATARSDGGFTVDEQTRRLAFSGELLWAFSGSRAADSRFWNLDDVDYTVTEGERAVFELRDASAGLYTVYPFANSMGGSFRIRSDATGGAMLRVNVVEELAFGAETYGAEEFEPALFTSGVLEIAGEDGSTLTLDAGTGERDTVEITLRAGEAIETFTASWSPWQDSIQCHGSTYGTVPLRGCLDPEG